MDCCIKEGRKDEQDVEEGQEEEDGDGDVEQASAAAK